MGTLRDFLKPNNPKEYIAMGIMFIAIFGFVGFQVYAFTTIMQNPLGDRWYSTDRMPNAYFHTMGGSDLFTHPTDTKDQIIFIISLTRFQGKSLSIQLDTRNCIFVKMVLASGEEYLSGNGYVFNPTNMTIINLENDTVNMNVRNMDYPHDYDMLFILADKMTIVDSSIELLYKVIINV